MKHPIYLVLIFIANLLLANGVETGISGKVTLKSDGEPVIFADIALYQNDILITGAQSDFDGNYSLLNLTSGLYDVEVSYVATLPSRILNVEIVKNKIVKLNFMLVPGITLECIEIVEYNIPLIARDNCCTGKTKSTGNHKLGTKNINSIASLSRGRKSKSTDYYLDGVKVSGKVAKETKRRKRKIDTKAIHDIVNPSVHANKLTATEVNDFADWEFWSTIHETDFLKTSLDWKMNPSQRYSVQLQNQEGFALSNKKVELINSSEEVKWTSVTDVVGKAELFDMFLSEEASTDELRLRVMDVDMILQEEKAILFNGTTQILTLDIACQDDRIMELAFMMDISGSMNDEMAYLRSEMSSIIQRTKQAFPDYIVQVAVIYFQGRRGGNETIFQDFSKDITEVNNFIHAQKNGDGQDEAIDRALQTLVDDLTWSSGSTKLAFLIGDEELDAVEENRNRQRSYTKKCAEQGIKIIPIGCSGMPKSLEYVMRSMAIATNGTYLALTDDSEIGNAHIKPTTNNIDAHSLNELLFDVISRYVGAGGCDHVVDAEGINILPPHISLNKKNENQEWNKDFKVYPNPTSGEFRVRQLNKSKIEAYYLCDRAGRIMKHFASDEKEFNISEFASGVYFFMARNEEGVFHSVKMIKTIGTSPMARR